MCVCVGVSERERKRTRNVEKKRAGPRKTERQRQTERSLAGSHAWLKPQRAAHVNNAIPRCSENIYRKFDIQCMFWVYCCVVFQNKFQKMGPPKKNS